MWYSGGAPGRVTRTTSSRPLSLVSMRASATLQGRTGLARRSAAAGAAGRAARAAVVGHAAAVEARRQDDGVLDRPVAQAGADRDALVERAQPIMRKPDAAHLVDGDSVRRDGEIAEVDLAAAAAVAVPGLEPRAVALDQIDDDVRARVVDAHRFTAAAEAKRDAVDLVGLERSEARAAAGEQQTGEGEGG